MTTQKIPNTQFYKARILCFVGAVLLFVLAQFGCSGTPRSLDKDESVMFLPTMALAADHNKDVTIDIHAWVFKDKDPSAFASALSQYLGIKLEEQPAEKKSIFAERTKYFNAESLQNKQIAVRIGDQVYPLSMTDIKGRAHAKIKIDPQWVEWDSTGLGRVYYTLETPGHADYGLKQYAWVLPREGVFVVSDVEDVIKHPYFLHNMQLLRNAFIEPFEAVNGAPERYREMAKNHRAFFVYLSVSPLPLYTSYSNFLDKEAFPPGYLYLRETSLYRSAFPKEGDIIEHKTNLLHRLANDFPDHQFILLGDSEQSDPEIYADFARQYPKRVIHINIQNVTGDHRDAKRFQKTFSGVKPEVWTLQD
ncbi:MAG: App1 family protein [Burkholderiales bacterium]|jgi:phosphatidate phosphatase APP1|nr:App1 family protein [Burkholderiales bacterium]